jgi:glycosyltransferase involved in cell wall biosynthesis
MKVGFFSPLPPARTGVADYSAALLPALRRLGRVTVGSDGDVNLYHVGNNQAHREIYRAALARPGVVVLHDAVLQHFFLGSFSEREYIAEFTYNYGEWSRSQAEHLWRVRASSAADPGYYEFPMLGRIAKASRAVIVHNPAAAREVRRHSPEACVVEIPHLWQPPPILAADARSRLGISPGAFLFGVFGFLRESKRIMAVLRAFESVRREHSNTFLLLAGEFVSSDLERAVTPMLRRPGIVREGYAPEREFRRLASAVDACINLRYPAAGETSGITLRLMGAGKPVFVTSGEETARFPEPACIRIDPGPAEQDMLAHYMMLFTECPQAALEAGRQAAGYVRAVHHLDRAAGMYWNTLCAHRS